jgi:hypothetical protein
VFLFQQTAKNGLRTKFKSFNRILSTVMGAKFVGSLITLQNFRQFALV